MHIIIIGCGRLGGTLAKDLSGSGYDVSILDRDSGRLSKLGNGFNGLVINGIEFDKDLLCEAGIKTADVILVVTADDNVNITVSLIAQKIFKVPRIIARINDPAKQPIYEQLGIETISPVRLGAQILKSRLTVKSLDIIASLDKDYEIVELTVGFGHLGTVRDIECKYSCIVSGIFKNGEFFLPKPKDPVDYHDKIICTIGKKDRDKVLTFVCGEVPL